MSENAAAATRPRTVLAAVVSLALAAVFGIGSGLSLFGAKDWLKQSCLDKKFATQLCSNGDVAAAEKFARDTPTSATFQSLLLTLMLVLLVLSAWKGRPSTKWTVFALWVFSLLLGLPVGPSGLFTVSGDGPLLYRLLVFAGALSLLVALVLVNLKPSVAWWDAHRVPRAPLPDRADRPSLRDLFAGRVPPPASTPSAPAKGRPASSKRPPVDGGAPKPSTATGRPASKSRRTGKNRSR